MPKKITVGNNTPKKIQNYPHNQIELKRERPPFTIVENAIIEDMRISKHGVMAFTSLCKHSDKDGKNCFPGLNTLARETRSGKSTVIGAIKELEHFGYIKVERRKDPKNPKRNRANSYTIVRQYDYVQKNLKESKGSLVQDQGSPNQDQGSPNQDQGSLDEVLEQDPFNYIPINKRPLNNIPKNNNNPDPVNDDSAGGPPVQDPVVAVAYELRSVLEDYRRLELSFTENQIRQHINKYGPDVISGAVKHFEENINTESVESLEAYFVWILNNYEKVRPIPEPEKIPERVLTDDEKELDQRQNKIKDIETRIYSGKYGSGFNPGEDKESLSQEHEKAIEEMEEFKTTMKAKGLFPANEAVIMIAGKMGK